MWYRIVYSTVQLGFNPEFYNNKLKIGENVQNVVLNNILKVPKNPAWGNRDMTSSTWPPTEFNF